MRLKRGRRIKDTSKKARKQRMNKVPLALVAATTVLSATGILTAEPVLAADTSSYTAGQKGKTTDWLNFRTGAGKNFSVIRVLAPNTTLTLLSRSGDFTKVQTSDGKTGWVCTTYLQVLSTPQPKPQPTPQPAPQPTPQPTPPSSGNGKRAQVTDYLNLRKGASTSSGVLSVLSPGTRVQYLNRSGNWAQVQLNDGRVGWVYSDYLVVDDPTNANRITTYPSEPNFYEVRQGLLYHVFGTPTNRTASYKVGEPASFMRPGDVYVRDSNHQFYRRDTSADVKVGAYIPAFEKLDLRLTTSVSAADLNAFIDRNRPDGLLAGHGQVFIDAQRKYGVSAQYLFAHAILESGWGTSQICRDKNNFFGYQAYDNSPYASAAYFQSIQDAVEYEAYFVRKQYLDATGQWFGGTPSLDGMNVHYASDPLWAEKIAGLMSSIRSYSYGDYSGKSPASVLGGTPTGPLKEIVTRTLPSGTTGVTLRGIDVYSMPSSDSSKVISHLQAGATLAVQGTQTDRWFQVQVGGQTGFVSVDNVKLSNILKVNVADALNLRSQPSTSGVIMGIVKNGTYLQAKLDGSGNPIVTNGWYQVSYNGSICYVYGQFVKQATTL